MTSSTRRVKFVGLLSVLCVSAGLLTASVAPSPAVASVPAKPPPLPAHLFAPYFETYAGTNLAPLSKQSRSPFLTLAFLETPTKGSCTLDWNGDPATPVAWSTFGHDITRIRAAGGDVIPSFGGYSADHGGRDIADSCTDVNAIATEYERVITTYGVRRLDLDVEDRSLKKPDAIARRNQAIALVEQWSVAHELDVQFVYTLPTGTSGLDPESVDILNGAVTAGARVDIVNVMTFDYYDGKPHEMAADTKKAARAVIAQLETVYPGESVASLYEMLGITDMIGIDDFGPAETFTVADAKNVEKWATANGIAELSFWALERDNGGCPGVAGSDHCSGIAQQSWAFSHAFAVFTAS